MFRLAPTLPFVPKPHALCRGFRGGSGISGDFFRAGHQRGWEACVQVAAPGSPSVTTHLMPGRKASSKKHPAVGNSTQLIAQKEAQGSFFAGQHLMRLLFCATGELFHCLQRREEEGCLSASHMQVAPSTAASHLPISSLGVERTGHPRLLSFVPLTCHLYYRELDQVRAGRGT